MKQRGFSLIELVVAMGVLAVLTAVAAPIYTGYVESSREGALVNNIATLEVFEEDVRLRTGAYVAGTYDVAGGDTSLTTATGWQPQVNDGTLYVVVLAGGSYEVTATDAQGTSVCRRYPQKEPC